MFLHFTLRFLLKTPKFFKYMGILYKNMAIIFTTLGHMKQLITQKEVMICICSQN